MPSAPAELLAAFPYLTSRPSSDHTAVDCPRKNLLGFLKDARDRQGYDMLMDVTAIDWAAGANPRFVCVYHLLSTTSHQYLRVVSPCDGTDDAPTMPSVTPLWPAADWHERETFDMFGIRFEGHPDLRRILMWDAYPYHPLRKEFPLAGHETEFPSAVIAERAGGVKVLPAPMMGGPFHSAPAGTISESEPRARDQSWTEKSPKPSETGEASKG